MDSKTIISLLPYTAPFLFVDKIHEYTEVSITGSYTFPVGSYFYAGHFKDHPITPGVILTECMAQIGLVCFGITLLENADLQTPSVALTGTDVEFYKPVFPGATVKVFSEKVYFRFNKLKCKVQMLDPDGKLICKGMISGMIIPNS